MYNRYDINWFLEYINLQGLMGPDRFCFVEYLSQSEKPGAYFRLPVLIIKNIKIQPADLFSVFRQQQV